MKLQIPVNGYRNKRYNTICTDNDKDADDPVDDVCFFVILW